MKCRCVRHPAPRLLWEAKRHLERLWKTETLSKATVGPGGTECDCGERGESWGRGNKEQGYVKTWTGRAEMSAALSHADGTGIEGVRLFLRDWIYWPGPVLALDPERVFWVESRGTFIGPLKPVNVVPCPLTFAAEGKIIIRWDWCIVSTKLLPKNVSIVSPQDAKEVTVTSQRGLTGESEPPFQDSELASWLLVLAAFSL